MTRHGEKLNSKGQVQELATEFVMLLRTESSNGWSFSLLMCLTQFDFSRAKVMGVMPPVSRFRGCCAGDTLSLVTKVFCGSTNVQVKVKVKAVL